MSKLRNQAGAWGNYGRFWSEPTAPRLGKRRTVYPFNAFGSRAQTSYDFEKSFKECLSKMASSAIVDVRHPQTMSDFHWRNTLAGRCPDALNAPKVPSVLKIFDNEQRALSAQSKRHERIESVVGQS